MKYIGIFILFLLSLTFISCEKMDVGDCFTGAGKTVIEHRDISYFENIVLEDNINLVITQDNDYSIMVEAGENMLEKIITEVIDSTLYVKNENTCNWVRDYPNKITAYISFKVLNNIDYNSSGNIIGTNTIYSDTLDISVWDGSGIIDLEIETKKSTLNLHYGAVDFYIRGRSGVNFIYASSYGPFYCENLRTIFTYMNNRGSNDCYVWATYYLGVDIENIGNIYYKGNPLTINANITGTGQLIPMEE